MRSFNNCKCRLVEWWLWAWGRGPGLEAWVGPGGVALGMGRGSGLGGVALGLGAWLWAWGHGSGAGSWWTLDPLTSCPFLLVHLLVPSPVDRQVVSMFLGTWLLWTLHMSFCGHVLWPLVDKLLGAEELEPPRVYFNLIVFWGILSFRCRLWDFWIAQEDLRGLEIIFQMFFCFVSYIWVFIWFGIYHVVWWEEGEDWQWGCPLTSRLLYGGDLHPHGNARTSTHTFIHFKFKS